MITIDIAGINLFLDDGFSLRLDKYNPCCYFDDIPGEKGMGITIPVNDQNRAVLKYPERFERYSTVASRKYPNTSIRFGGYLLQRGTLVVTSATSEGYECWLQSELGVMSEELREKKITDFAWPTAKEFANIPVDEYSDDPVTGKDYGVVEFYNRGFWDGKGKEENTTTTYIDEYGRFITREEKISAMQKQHFANAAYKINRIKEDNTILADAAGAVVSPFLYFRYVIKEALRLNQWFIYRNDMVPAQDYALTFQYNLMVYNNFNILQMVFHTEERTHSYWDYELNEDVIYNTEEILVDAWELRPFNYADLLPKISMSEFLLGIQNSLNFVFHFRQGYKVDIIDRNAVFETTAFDLTPWVVEDWEMGERKNLQLKFTPEFDKDDAMIGQGYEDLTARWKDFKPACDTYQQLLDVANPEFGDLRACYETGKIYEYKWKVAVSESPDRLEDQFDSVGWEVVSTSTQPYLYNSVTGEQQEEIKTKLSSIEQTLLFPLGIQLQVYNAVQKGNLHQMRSSFSDFGFRMLTPVIFNTYKLFWEGGNGLFEHRWKNWATFWATRQPCTVKLRLPLGMITYISENITQKFRTEKGEFIIESMQTEIALDMIGETTLTGYKI